MRLPYPDADFANKIAAVGGNRVTNELKFDTKSKYYAGIKYPLINALQQKTHTKYS